MWAGLCPCLPVLGYKYESLMCMKNQHGNSNIQLIISFRMKGKPFRDPNFQLNGKSKFKGSIM